LGNGVVKKKKKNKQKTKQKNNNKIFFRLSSVRVRKEEKNLEIYMLFLFPSSSQILSLHKLKPLLPGNLNAKLESALQCRRSGKSFTIKKRAKNPYRINDLVPSQRNGLGKFQGNI